MRQPLARYVLAVVCLASPGAYAEKISVDLTGLPDDIRDRVLAGLPLQQYADRDATPAQIRRLFNSADEEIAELLRPFGFYDARVTGELQPTEGGFNASFTVIPGERVLVRKSSVEIMGESTSTRLVDEALAAFEPDVGEPLVHADYEDSKARIGAALRSSGYLDSELERHRVEVTKAANAADIDLAWSSGERYRFGEVRFSDSQFPREFLRRYVPWREGEFYSDEQLLLMQQRLVDADYFATVAVQPVLDERAEGVVPIEVGLVPAKRSVYSAGAYVSTDSGPGVRLGFERRWLNDRGHKLRTDLQYAQRLQDASVSYVIPRPGPNNSSLNFGIRYRNEETDTSKSEMLRLAGNESRQWRGYTRTIGLQFLQGDFEIADQSNSTTLLYADGTLTRRRADDIAFPRRGDAVIYNLRIGPEDYLSETRFAQLRADARWIRPSGDRHRVLLRAALGAMTVDDFDELPPELRFFAGGDRSVRGFDYQAIGETNATGGVIGGEYLVVASAEYEHYFLESWGAAVFVDAGDAFRSEFDANVGTGIGLRWKSPIGVLRVDVGFPVVTELEDDGLRLHLVIGPDL